MRKVPSTARPQWALIEWRLGTAGSASVIGIGTSDSKLQFVGRGMWQRDAAEEWHLEACQNWFGVWRFDVRLQMLQNVQNGPAATRLTLSLKVDPMLEGNRKTHTWRCWAFRMYWISSLRPSTSTNWHGVSGVHVDWTSFFNCSTTRQQQLQTRGKLTLLMVGVCVISWLTTTTTSSKSVPKYG